MKRYTNILIFILTITLASGLTLLISGCSENPTDNNLPTGSLAMNITVASSELMELVTTFDLTAIGEFGSRTTALRMENGLLVGQMEVPAGQVRFTARAYDGSRVIYEGSTVVTVVADRVTPIDINLMPVVSLIKLSPRYTTVPPGLSVAFTVRVFNVPDLNQISFRLNYDDMLIYPDSVMKNPDLGRDVLLYDTLLYTTSGWAMAFINTNQVDTLVDNSGNVTLATAYFRTYFPETAQFGPDTTTITFSALTMYDIKGDSIPSASVYQDSCTIIIQQDTIPFAPSHEPVIIGNY